MDARVERTEPSLRPPPLAASAEMIEAVLGDDNLLREILLHLGFPTCLVRAAAVSKRWLRHASDPSFLHRFRDRNPPRLLGFYLTSLEYHLRRRLADFVPILTQPPELGSVLPRGCFSLNAYEGPTMRIMDCRNGRVFISIYHPAKLKFTHGVHTPLHPARGLVIVPKLPMISHEGSLAMTSDILSQESEDGLSYFWFTMEFITNGGSHVCVYKLQVNVWRMLFSARIQLDLFPPRSPNNLIVEDKFYVAATRTSILVLDLTSSSFSTIELPDGVINKGDTVMSRTNDSGVYLVHLKELQLSFWLLRGTNGSAGDWLLVDTISLHDMCANLGVKKCTAQDGFPVVCLKAVGDNAEFVFLDMDQCILYLDVRSRALRKVYEKSEYFDSEGCWVCPYMMLWPPIFPAPKE